MQQTVKVAERIMLSAQRDMWALADAVLTDVPDAGRGGDHSPVDGGMVATVGEQLDALALVLIEQGVTKPNGEPYTPGYLRDVRDTAMTWAPDERRTESSFEAHRENAGVTRPVFVALCKHAAGEVVKRPRDVDPDAWRDALDKMKARRHGFKVQAQAVRIATGKRAKNTPATLDRATFAELCQHLSTAIDGIEAFAEAFRTHTITDDGDRARFRGLLKRLIDRATFAFEVVGTEVTDEALAAELLDDGGER